MFFNVIIGAMGIGQTAPYFEAFAIAKGAAGKVFSIIERVSTIDCLFLIVNHSKLN